MRKLLVGLGAGLSLFVILAFLAPFLVDLDGYKSAILERLERYLPGKIDFRHLELTLVPGFGVEVQGLTLEDNSSFPQGLFVQVERLRVRLRILPLLRKQIRVKSVVVQGPVVRLKRTARGGTSFPDLAGGGSALRDGSRRPGETNRGGGSSGLSSPEPRTWSPAGGTQPGFLAMLLVNELEIERGQILIEDDTLFPQDGPLRVEGVDLRVKDLSLDRPVSVELAAGLAAAPEQNLHLAGRLGPLGEDWRWERIPFDFKVTLKSLPADRLPSVLLRGLPVRVASGSVSLDLEAEGSLDGRVRVGSVLEVEGLALEVPGGMAGGERTGVFALKFEHQGNLEYPLKRVTTESALVSLNQNRVRFKGTVQVSSPAPEWDLEVWTEQLHPDSLLPLFPLLAQHWPQDLQIEGPVGAWLKSAGNPESLTWEARLDLEGTRVQVREGFLKPAGAPISLEGQGTKEGKRIVLNLVRLKHPDLALGVSGEVLAEPRPQFTLVLQSEPVPLETLAAFVPPLSPYGLEGKLLLRGSWRGRPDDALLNLQVSSDRIRFRVPSPSAPQEEASVDQSGSVEALEVGAQLRKGPDGIDGTAEIEASKAEIRAFPFEGLSASLQFYPERVRVSALECRALGGNVEGRGEYDLNSRAWTVRPAVNGVSVAQVMDRLTRYHGLFAGVLSGDFVVDSQPAEGQPDLLRTQGTVRVSRGELRNLDLVDAVWDGLFRAKGMAQLLGELGTGAGREATTRFDWLEGHVEGRGPAVQVNSLHLHNVRSGRAKDTDVFLAGKVGLDDDSLDLKGRVVLSPRHSERLARQAALIRALMNPEGRVSFPFRLQGSIQKPVPFADVEYVAGALSRHYLRQGLQEGIETREEGSGDGEEGKNGLGQPIDDLLRGLIR